MAKLEVNQIGHTVARTGLLPETASYFIDYIKTHKEDLLNFLPDAISAEDWDEELNRAPNNAVSEQNLTFILSHLCFSSPEYEETQTPKQRYLPYMLSNERRESEQIKRVHDILAIQPWDRNIGSINAAEIAVDYASGVPLVDIEGRFENLSGGMIHNMLRDHASHLSGLADILDTLTPQVTEENSKLLSFLSPNDDQRTLFRRLLRAIRLFIKQIGMGVPEDVLWMRVLKDKNDKTLLSRNAILQLREHNITTLDDFLDQGKKNDFHQAMNDAGIINVGRDQVIVAAKLFRSTRTQSAAGRLTRQISDCGNVIGDYFSALGHDFERALERCFNCLDFDIVEKDGDEKDRFPDFVVDINNGTHVVIECKSKENRNEVQLGDATEVGAKAVAHGLNRYPMVTVCQPYVSTDVSRKIKSANDLSVINAEDLALAMGALKRERISKDQFYDWLTTPGQPRIDDLFH